MTKEAWPQVAEQASAILAEEPKNAAALLLRGIALRHAEKPDEALEAYEKAEKLSGGGLAEVYLARGVLLMRDRSECEPALEEFARYTRRPGRSCPRGRPSPRSSGSATRCSPRTRQRGGGAADAARGREGSRGGEGSRGREGRC